MEVAIGGTNSTPFREVHEWQHVDPNTGALINSRLESDRWVNGPLNTYGKMVQHNLSTPDGTKHTHKKQMEILQARTATGSYQVVRAQTVHSSSSRWSSSSSTATGATTTQSHSNSILNSGDKSSAINLNSLLTTATNPHINNNIQNHFHIPKLHHQHKEVDLLQSKNLHSSLLMPTENKFTSVGGSFSNSNGMSKSKATSNSNNHMDFNKKFNSNERETGDAGALATSVTATTATKTSSSSSSLLSSSSSSILSSAVTAAAAATTTTTESLLMRGKSISTEDLKTEDNFDNDLDEPIEWKRVSKIRRSLQFPRTTAPKIQTRPPDLPENSVSVFKIRQELENGRRLSTAMKNNHVDFVALDNILKNVTETAPISATVNSGSKSENKSKKTTYITAESLKEIRGKLRRLSNESLYREDMSPTDESIGSSGEEKKYGTDVDVSGHQDKAGGSSPNDSDICSHTVTNSIFLTKQNHQHISTTNSLDTSRSRTKDKDIPNEDWLLRRKSYAFEKMTHPSENLSNMDSSTDSGIGRSSEISSSWSNMESMGRGTVVTIGETNKLPALNTTRITLTENGVSEESKRHSIAVDESRYVRNKHHSIFEKKSSVLVNSDSYSALHEGSSDENNKRHKRVEFCKTEVHFAPDSGRVNIVETDGKPPSTNNFRRRRRTTSGNVSSSYLDAINSGMNVTHFGDTKSESLVTSTENLEGTTTTMEVSQLGHTVVTTSIGKVRTEDSSRYDLDETEMNQDDSSIRGILKNKPIKPKPYHLGDNMAEKESLWGVRLRPVSSDYPSRRNLDIERVKSPVTSLEHPLAEEEKSLKDNQGYSTKVNLSATIPNSFSWQNKDLAAPRHLSPLKGEATPHSAQQSPSQPPQQQSTTKICIDMTSGDVRGNSTTTTNAPIASGAGNEFKSTSLIMKTLRSANQFDEALKKLEMISNKQELENRNSAFHLVKSTIAKSNSANSIFRERMNYSLAGHADAAHSNKYASSLDGGDYRNTNDFLDMKDSHSNSADQQQLESINEENNRTYFNRTSIASTSFKTNYERNSNELSRLSNFKDFVAKHYSGKSDNILKEQNTNLAQPLGVAANAGTTAAAITTTTTAKPIAAPRIKKLESNVLSHQLSQLRRMYDAAEQDDSDDSAKADEEVNSYLGGLGQPLADDKISCELSGSWSRVKAKRNSLKQSSVGLTANSATCSANSEFKMLHTKTKSESAPHVIAFKVNAPATATAHTASVAPRAVPTVQPRVMNPVNALHHQASPKFQRKELMTTTTTTPAISHQTTISTSTAKTQLTDDKKIMKLAPGTRQLRQHELSYFGITTKSDSQSSFKSESIKKQSSSSSTTLFNDLKSSSNLFSAPTTTKSISSLLTTATAAATTPTNKQNIKNFNTDISTRLTTTSSVAATATSTAAATTTAVSSHPQRTSNKWQLSNDKPDLLKHSHAADDQTSAPAISSNFTKSYSLSKNSKLRSLTTSASSTNAKMDAMAKADGSKGRVDSKKATESTDDHFYENLRKDSSYERKLDLHRDERILEELTRAADEMLNSVKDLSDGDNDEEIFRSFIKQKSPSLDTINEYKTQPQKIMKSKGVQVSKHFTEAHSLRASVNGKLSSASSQESVSRTPQLSSRAANISRRKTTATQYTNGYSKHSHQAAPAPSPVSSRSSSSRRKITNSTESTRRIHRVCSKEKLQQQSQASSSEDLSTNPAEAPRPRPRRIKTVKERERSESDRIAKSNGSANSVLSTGSKNIFERLSSTKSSSRGITNSIADQQKIRTKTGTILTATTSATSRRKMR